MNDARAQPPEPPADILDVLRIVLLREDLPLLRLAQTLAVDPTVLRRLRRVYLLERKVSLLLGRLRQEVARYDSLSAGRSEAAELLRILEGSSA